MVDAPIQKQTQEPQETPPQPAAAAQPELQKLIEFVRGQGQSVLIGLGLAVAVFLGVGAYRNYRHSTELRASQMLMGARNVEQLQQVVSQYSSTPSAPVAMLSLAAQYFDGGQYDLAQFTYTQFEQKYPKHPMVKAAELGKAQCLEAAGQVEQAAGAFDEFVKNNPEHFLTSLARLGKARCLNQLGKYAEAKAAYEDFIAANPESGWTPLAETGLLFVEKEMRAKAKSPESAATEPVVSAAKPQQAIPLWAPPAPSASEPAH
jgi:predicted negative regulator of RcsB-dependent stress response